MKWEIRGTKVSTGLDRLSSPELRSVTSVEAAYLLNVEPNTLRMWERRFDFPTSLARTGERRDFPLDEIVALRTALLSGHSIAAAVAAAQCRPRDRAAHCETRRRRRALSLLAQR